MTSNAASTAPVTADVPSPRGGAPTVADEAVFRDERDDSDGRSGSAPPVDTGASPPPVDGSAPTARDGAGDGSTPDRSTPDRSTPARSTPDTSTADASVNDTSLADESSADRSTADGPAADTASAVPDAAVPDAAVPDAAVPDADGTEAAGAEPAAAATAVNRPLDEASLGPDPAGLHGRLVEARERLRPEGPTIPAPRSPQGVTVPPAFGGRQQPEAAIVAAIDQVVADLAAVRAKPDEPAHHALVRLGELTAGEIPDAGWSRAEGLEPEVVAEAADLAEQLHTTTSALLERLDAEELLASAVVVDAAATSLQVMRMVADLEVFARSRG